MALAATELADIERVLSASDAASQAYTELRAQFPHLSWVRCDASDVTEIPFRSFRHFDLHLLDGSEHCVQITADPAQATGLVLARRTLKS